MKGFPALPWLAATVAIHLAPISANAGIAFTNLYSFASQGTDAHTPSSTLLLASDGYLYGTTAGRGGNGCVFKISPAGHFTTLVSFNGTNGANLMAYFSTASLIEARDGNLYGTTSTGGPGYGTIFRVTTNGSLTVLHAFDGLHGTNGCNPAAALVEGPDGWLYGTGHDGGRGGIVGNGTIYKVNTNGFVKTLHYFLGTNGAFPAAPLIVGKDGCLYGTTPYGGLLYATAPSEFGAGTIFKITTNGLFTSLLSFTGTNGAQPYSSLLQAADGNFYGTTRNGGNGCGTVFKLTQEGAFLSLFSFSGTNGARPTAALIQGRDGYLYGTTSSGGLGYDPARTNAPMYGNGTIFRISTNGILTTLLRLESKQGEDPVGTLVQSKEGDFFGTAPYGGAYGEGTVFRFRITPDIPSGSPTHK